MLIRNIITTCFLTIGLTLTLPACSPGSQAVSTSTPTPTPMLTLTPIPEPAPTPLVINQADLSTYTHPNNRFSTQYPASWVSFERPDGVIFVEPNNQAGYSIVFTDVSQTYNDQALNQYLVTFVAQNFAGPGFKAISQEQAADGSVTAQFASTDPNLGPTINEIRVLQKETIIFVTNFNTSEEQWDISYAQLKALADSFTPLNTGPMPTPQPTSEPPEWTLIGPESKEFGFLYADNWEILELEQNVVSVGVPDTGMIFTASKFAWPQARIDPNAAEKAALAHLDNLTAEYKNVQSLAPTEFPLDTATGATIDFLYTTDDNIDMAGSVITAVHDGKMHKVVFMAPANSYNAALQWFNPMYKSFKFLNPDKFVEK